MQLKDVTPIIKAILEERDKIPRIIDKERYIPNPQPYHDGNFMRGGIRKALRIIEQAPAVDATPRWISVEERLPEGEGWVLAIGLLLKKKHKGDYGWCVPHVAEYRHGRWCDSDGMLPDLEERSLKITHWMPLPEPPKEVTS